MKQILLAIYLLLISVASRETFAQQLSNEKDFTTPVIPIRKLDMHRVEQIAKLLNDKPAGFGNPSSDRATWESLKASGKYQKVIKEASSMLIKEFPEFDMEAYMGMFTKGDSQSGKDILTSRLRWMVILCWAECLENNGKYIPKLELVIEELIKQKTWVNPRNYTEETFGGLVELSTASYMHNMAQVLYLLGDKLSPTTRKNIKAALHTRAFNPILATIAGNDRNHNWLTSTNNWNAVCLSGITGAALTTLTDKKERAKFVAIAERYVQNFIAGFHNDGYCTEGIGYYNYGFGRFITLRENIFQSTNGKIDLFDDPKINKIAGFLPNMQIVNGTYPAIADCRIDTKPGSNIMYYTSRNLGMGLSEYNTISLLGSTSDLVADVMYAFPNTASKAAPAKAGNLNYAGIRSYFNEAGILTVRPMTGIKGNFGAVLKGGKNDEHHNHNDLGSYTIAIGDEVLMGDPGLIPYTAKTFGPQRYDYKTLASYGHPVPLVAGQQQRTGNEAEAKIVRAEFTDKQDLFDMDITSAYNVASLKSLIRKFDYQRVNNISLKVSDVFQFSEAQIFETAIITRSSWQHDADGQIVLQGKRGKLIANLQVPEGGYSLHSEQIMEENGIPYTRLGIRLKQPHTAGAVTITYQEE
tara:strand:+ start:1231 stop:3147 length:1917 start_codon:yes stop_codon:yes gene_type:complete